MSHTNLTNKGFTLLEIMIAMTVFSFFVTAYVVSQGNNLADSSNMRYEYEMKNILEQEINQIIINPPEFTPSLLLTTENDYKTVEDFEEYELRVQWFEFKLPDISQLSQSAEGDETTNNSQETVQAKIFENVSKNLQALLWQLKVTLRHKETLKEMDSTTWLLNQKAEVRIEGF